MNHIVRAGRFAGGSMGIGIMNKEQKIAMLNAKLAKAKTINSRMCILARLDALASQKDA